METHTVDSDRLSQGKGNPPSSPYYDSKDEEIVQTDMLDIEANAYVDGEYDADERKGLVDRSEVTELTPVEAFKWNVEGDQSPCKYYFLRREFLMSSRSIKLQLMVLVYALSPRGGGLCT